MAGASVKAERVEGSSVEVFLQSDMVQEVISMVERPIPGADKVMVVKPAKNNAEIETLEHENLEGPVGLIEIPTNIGNIRSLVYNDHLLSTIFFFEGPDVDVYKRRRNQIVRQQSLSDVHLFPGGTDAVVIYDKSEAAFRRTATQQERAQIARTLQGESTSLESVSAKEIREGDMAVIAEARTEEFVVERTGDEKIETAFVDVNHDEVSIDVKEVEPNQSDSIGAQISNPCTSDCDPAEWTVDASSCVLNVISPAGCRSCNLVCSARMSAPGYVACFICATQICSVSLYNYCSCIDAIYCIVELGLDGAERLEDVFF
ncbi:hypothetical protein [Natronococcus occultus]|nr:hypothetical protein [Natronococcus occultus]